MIFSFLHSLVINLACYYQPLSMSLSKAIFYLKFEHSFAALQAQIFPLGNANLVIFVIYYSFCFFYGTIQYHFLHQPPRNETLTAHCREEQLYSPCYAI